VEDVFILVWGLVSCLLSVPAMKLGSLLNRSGLSWKTCFWAGLINFGWLVLSVLFFNWQSSWQHLFGPLAYPVFLVLSLPLNCLILRISWKKLWLPWLCFFPVFVFSWCLGYMFYEDWFHIPHCHCV